MTRLASGSSWHPGAISLIAASCAAFWRSSGKPNRARVALSTTCVRKFDTSPVENGGNSPKPRAVLIRSASSAATSPIDRNAMAQR